MISFPNGVSGHQRTAAPTAAGTIAQTANNTQMPVQGPAIKPTSTAPRKERAQMTASAPPEGMKNSRTRNTRPNKSNASAQPSGVISRMTNHGMTNDQ